MWAALAMPLWLGLMGGHLQFASTYGAVAWHAHEFLFGYVAAIVAGFLLTAVPNWTGRLPVHGGALLALFAVWVIGRLALLAVDAIGFIPAAALDSLFLPGLAAVVLREVIAGRNQHNIKVAVLVTLLAAANILFHTEVFTSGVAAYALRAGIAAVVGLIMLIGGRITPSFTRNWLVKQTSNHLPESFGRLDVAALGAGGLALLLWIVMPEGSFTGMALLAAGILHAFRLSRWAGAYTWREPLVLVLHLGYAFVPLGFLLVGASIFWFSFIPVNAALHAWTAGAMGIMTLAVMTRATLGHTGRELTATPGTKAIYIAAGLAALARIAAPLLQVLSQPMLTVAAIAWTVAFAGFVLLYGPMLLKPRFVSG